MKEEPWECPPVHPAAEMLPLMGDAELAELAADIKANGLQEPIVVWVDNREEPNGAKRPFVRFLLDGRNRVEALKRIGHSRVRAAEVAAFRLANKRWEPWVDPELYVLSANVHRRHLSPEQKREAIARFIKAAPQASDREVAKAVKADHKTVAAVRKETGPSGEVPQMGRGHLPIERAKAAVRANPGASANDIAEAAKVGRATAQRAQKLVAAKSKAGAAAEPEPELSVIDAEQEMQKQAERFRQTVQRAFLSWNKQFAEGIGGVDRMREIVAEELARCFYEDDTPDRLRFDALYPAPLDDPPGQPPT